MKRLVTLLIMVFLLALAPAVSFAADKAPQNEQAADEEGRGDVIDEEGEEDGRGDVIDGETSFLDMFPMGMSKDDALQAGAKASSDDDVLLHSGSWLDAEWDSSLMFENGELAVLAMQTALDHRTLMSSIEYLTENAYTVMDVTGVDGKEIPFYTLKAEGKSDEALSGIFDKALEAFADADKGECMILFCLDDTLNGLVEVIKDKGDAEEFFKKEVDTILYVIQLDKGDDTMLLMMTTFGALNKQ